MFRNEIGCEPIRRVALSRQTKELVVDAAEVEGWQREHTAAEVNVCVCSGAGRRLPLRNLI